MSKAEPLRGVTEANLLNLLDHVHDEMTGYLNQNGEQLSNFRTIKQNVTKVIHVLDVEHPGYAPSLVIHERSLDGIREEEAEDVRMKGTDGLMERYWPALVEVVRRHFKEVDDAR